MATNLGSANGTTWTSGNMKPEVDDQTDAVWAQNMADNNSYAVWGKEQKAFDVGIQDNQNFGAALYTGAMWRKYPLHDTLKIRGTLGHANTGGGQHILFIDGTNLPTFTTASGDSGTFIEIDWDQTHLTDGNYYQFETTVQATGGVDKAWSYISAWTGTLIGL